MQTNWIRVEDGMPPSTPPILDPATDTVWIYTDWGYAARYGVGYWDYGIGEWFVQGCKGRVTHWAVLVPPSPENGQTK